MSIKKLSNGSLMMVKCKRTSGKCLKGEKSLTVAGISWPSTLPLCMAGGTSLLKYSSSSSSGRLFESMSSSGKQTHVHIMTQALTTCWQSVYFLLNEYEPVMSLLMLSTDMSFSFARKLELLPLKWSLSTPSLCTLSSSAVAGKG